MYNITLRNSPNFHVSVGQTDGFTAWGVKIMTPGTARNTDGIDPSSSRNVTITHCYIHTGDDDVAVKSGRAHMLDAQQEKQYAPATWLRGSDNWNPYLLPQALPIY